MQPAASRPGMKKRQVLYLQNDSRNLGFIAVEGNQEHNTLRIRGHETIFGGENRTAVGIVD